MLGRIPDDQIFPAWAEYVMIVLNVFSVSLVKDFKEIGQDSQGARLTWLIGLEVRLLDRISGAFGVESVRRQGFLGSGHGSHADAMVLRSAVADCSHLGEFCLAAVAEIGDP